MSRERAPSSVHKKSLKFILFTVIYLLVSANPSIAKPDMGSGDQKNAAIEDDVPGDSDDEVAGESEDEVTGGSEEEVNGEVTEGAEGFKGTKREASAQPSHKVGSSTGSKSAMGVKKGVEKSVGKSAEGPSKFKRRSRAEGVEGEASHKTPPNDPEKDSEKATAHQPNVKKNAKRAEGRVKKRGEPKSQTTKRTDENLRDEMSQIPSKEGNEPKRPGTVRPSSEEGSPAQSLNEGTEEQDLITKVLLIFLFLSLLLNFIAYKVWGRKALDRLLSDEDLADGELRSVDERDAVPDLYQEDRIPSFYPQHYEVANQLLQLCLARRNVSNFSGSLIFNMKANVIFDLEDKVYRRRLPVSDDELWREQRLTKKSMKGKAVKPGDELSTWAKENFDLDARGLSQINKALVADRLKGDLSQLLSLGTLIERVKHPKYGTLLILRGIALENFDTVELRSKLGAQRSLLKGVWYEIDEEKVRGAYQVSLSGQVYQCRVVEGGTDEE